MDTSQPDPDAAAEFYSGIFGWELENVMPPGTPGKYLMARLGGGDVAAIGSPPAGAPPMAVWNTYVCVDSADETAAKVRDAGGDVLTEPFDVMDAGRMAAFADPEGAVFCVWQPGRTKGAQVVNEPGALNFNHLNTRDAERARAFYGAVFGWSTMELPGGLEMWTLAGYGDHLEELNPGNRERIAEIGAQPGFEDVVASLFPLEAPEIPPHWGVTFGAEDVDALARRAEELGGRVVVPPRDAPWVRMTVIVDPQGAMFVASEFVPENKDLVS